MVTGVLTVTAAVVMANAAELAAPAFTLTELGTAATAGLLLVSFTAAPDGGAGDSNVTVLEPPAAWPPTMDEEARFTAATPSGATVSVAVTLTPEKLAVMVTGVLAATYPAVMVNGGETEALLGTVTEAGTYATAGLELDRPTTMPLVGASTARLMVLEFVDSPAVMVVAANSTAPGVAASKFTPALAMNPGTPFRPAKIATVVLEPTAAVLMVKAGEAVAPAATVTEAGIETSAGLEGDRLKTNPPAGAGLASVRVFEVSGSPPATEVAGRVNATAMGLTVRMAVAGDPFTVAVMVTGVPVETAEVVMVNADETMAPAPTVTEAGTDATAGFELERLTVHPPGGAALLRVTVFDGSPAPPMILDCARPTEAVNVEPLPLKLTVCGPPGKLPGIVKTPV